MTKIELIKKFEAITDEILKLDIESDDIIDMVETKLKERERIIEEMNQYDVEISQEILNRLLYKNNAMKEKFSEIMLKINNSVELLVKEKSLSSKKKKAHRGYLNPGYQKDGYFIDKKK